MSKEVATDHGKMVPVGKMWDRDNLELVRPIIDELESKLVVKKAVRTKTIPVSENLRKAANVPKHILSIKVAEAAVVLRRPTDEETDLYAGKCAAILTGSSIDDAKRQLSEWIGFEKNYKIVNVSTRETWDGAPPAVTWVVYDCNEVTARVAETGEEVDYYSAEDPAPVEGIRDYGKKARYSSLFYIGE